MHYRLMSFCHVEIVIDMKKISNFTTLKHYAHEKIDFTCNRNDNCR